MLPTFVTGQTGECLDQGLPARRLAIFLTNFIFGASDFRVTGQRSASAGPGQQSPIFLYRDPILLKLHQEEDLAE